MAGIPRDGRSAGHAGTCLPMEQKNKLLSHSKTMKAKPQSPKAPLSHSPGRHRGPTALQNSPPPAASPKLLSHAWPVGVARHGTARIRLPYGCWQHHPRGKDPLPTQAGARAATANSQAEEQRAEQSGSDRSRQLSSLCEPKLTRQLHRFAAKTLPSPLSCKIARVFFVIIILNCEKCSFET